MTTQTFTLDADERRTILRQIGNMNILAISGGRVAPLPDGVELPVGSGYRVRVRLTPADDYTVERVFVRNGREFSKGIRERVYCDEVGETAYRASCFRNDDAVYWPEAVGK
jgi:hypothetical protein